MRVTSGARTPLAYIETSALLAALLDKDRGAKRSLRAATLRIASSLTIVEARRALVRARTTGRIDDKQARLTARALQTFARRCALVPITDDILDRAARPFPAEPVRTLDAIHLASAEFLGEPPALITIVTRDERIRRNAEAMGYIVA